MVAVALIVLLLALLLTIGVLTGAGESLSVDLLGSEVTTSGSGLYIAGLITGLATLAALWLLRIGLRKELKQRKRIRDLERRADRADDPHGSPTAGQPSSPSDGQHTDGDGRGKDADGDRQQPARADSGSPASDRDNS
ncbi:hypothetical protein [Jiangella alba]|uniref:Lipopolysaccharide assembly protein A domain-containing protein n=1 Tax=Jiangella alba TaxID=561176 RepID=A0A1H5PFU5_9ACTN|nr:hypothetical protein [Jiangella alba]SEF12792.1 hypothetical protein SAMN04488561_4294 [Jiangella alba]